MNQTLKKNSADFDWIKERSLCSLNQVFETLKRQILKDVESCNALRSEGATYKFSANAPTNDTFLVVKESTRLLGSITFSLTNKGISVLDTNDKPLV